MLYIKTSEEVSTLGSIKYIYNYWLYSYDRERIKEGDLNSLISYYCREIVPFADFVSVSEFVDWVNELEDAEIEDIIKNY